MDAAHLQRRIQVVVVSTRAAASSLRTGHSQYRAAVERGIRLLDGMDGEVRRTRSAATRDRLANARRDLESLLEDVPAGR